MYSTNNENIGSRKVAGSPGRLVRDVNLILFSISNSDVCCLTNCVYHVLIGVPVY
jgi:hypothetical protein